MHFITSAFSPGAQPCSGGQDTSPGEQTAAWDTPAGTVTTSGVTTTITPTGRDAASVRDSHTQLATSAGTRQPPHRATDGYRGVEDVFFAQDSAR